MADCPPQGDRVIFQICINYHTQFVNDCREKGMTDAEIFYKLTEFGECASLMISESKHLPQGLVLRAYKKMAYSVNVCSIKVKHTDRLQEDNGTLDYFDGFAKAISEGSSEFKLNTHQVGDLMDNVKTAAKTSPLSRHVGHSDRCSNKRRRTINSSTNRSINHERRQPRSSGDNNTFVRRNGQSSSGYRGRSQSHHNNSARRYDQTASPNRSINHERYQPRSSGDNNTCVRRNVQSSSGYLERSQSHQNNSARRYDRTTSPDPCYPKKLFPYNGHDDYDSYGRH